ncbi:MAG: hypothetical protein ACOX41_06730 [Anaerovoracaceae bacterium]
MSSHLRFSGLSAAGGTDAHDVRAQQPRWFDQIQRAFALQLFRCFDQIQRAFALQLFRCFDQIQRAFALQLFR